MSEHTHCEPPDMVGAVLYALQKCLGTKYLTAIVGRSEDGQLVTLPVDQALVDAVARLLWIEIR